MIGIATADLSALHGDDLDRPLIEAALHRAGTGGRYVRWDDDSTDWSGFDLVVLRSTWDYLHRLPEFLAWLDALPVPVLNPPATVRWNCDKRYLAALAGTGVPVVPTAYASGPQGWDGALASVATPQLVVKPTVSAGSDLTGRFEIGDPAAAELAGRIWAAGKVGVVQPLVSAAGSRGDLAVIGIGGRFSHAVRKGPLLDVGGGLLGGEYTETVEAAEPEGAELELARQALAAYATVSGVAEPLLYSRTDIVTGDDGAPMLLELELIEPSLFLEAPGDAGGAAAADRLVAAVIDRLPS